MSDLFPKDIVHMVAWAVGIIAALVVVGAFLLGAWIW